MVGAYPRAVIWDETVRHHQTVLVDRRLGIVTVWCYECEKGYELYERDIDFVRRCIDGDDAVQCVAWVERFRG